MPSHPRSAWTRLGELLRRRRIELDSRYRNRRTFEAERAAGLYRIINDIELGRRDNYEPGTIAALEAAYDLVPGVIGHALAGGELEVQRPVAADTAAAADEVTVLRSIDPAAGVLPGLTPEQETALQRYIREVRADLARAMSEHGPGFSGHQAFSSDDEARLWDARGFAGDGSQLTPAQTEALIAALRLASAGGLTENPARQFRDNRVLNGHLWYSPVIHSRTGSSIPEHAALRRRETRAARRY